jgi:hypothetical protein
MSYASPVGVVSPAGVEYLQRAGADPLAEAAGGPRTVAPPALRRLVRVDGVSYLQRPGTTQGDAGADIPTENVLVALAGARAPVAFVLEGSPAAVRFKLGTWGVEGAVAPTEVDARLRLLEAALQGVYPAVDSGADRFTPVRWPLGGLALGVPTVKPPDRVDGTVAVDRLVRAMGGMRWAVVVLAEPLEEDYLAAVAHSLINEMRSVASFERSAGAPSPLANHYTRLLEHGLDIVTRGQSIGAWRTAVYLLGDDTSYPCLASAWRAIHSGPASLPEPVRVFDGTEAVALAARWGLPDAPGPAPTGGFQHPFACQTILSSRELSGLVQLPQSEAPGFGIRVAPSFDVVPPHSPSDDAIPVGMVMSRERPTEQAYSITPRSLTRHAFVAGVTGSGKTNTILHVLTQVAARGVPFLVIEPAKTEYRALLEHPDLGPRLRVFTPGKERVAPLRVNPFEVPPGSPVAEHLDLLRAVFGASFAMWGPLPHVLERCLHEVYEDRGWDMRTNENRRLDGSEASWLAFPTLTDLAAKVNEVAPRLGYEQRVTDDIRAALMTRLDSLRGGGKGAMLDVAASVPMDELFGAPTVIELEGVGDDDDKAFLIGLLLVRLAEHRRAAGQADGLTHLLVVEEAHRLLTNVARRASEHMGDPRGQAVETFTNLLSEIRAYGQGVLIADQVPVRLAPDVIKNTNLKLAHRIVASDDRAVLGGTMAMSDAQTRYVSTLGTGRAAAFSEGDDAPVLVAIPRMKDGAPPPDDATVAAAMARWRSERDLEAVYQARPFCVQTCVDARWACEMARQYMDDEFVQRTVSRVALSTAEHPEALDRMWLEVVGILRARRPARVDEQVLLRAFAGHAADWYASRRGVQGGWAYRVTEALGAALREVLLEKVAGGVGTSTARETYRSQMQELHRRFFDPYPACGRVCDHAPLCLYRSAVRDLVRSRRYDGPWEQAEAADASADGGARRAELWRASWSSSYELVELPHEQMPAAVRNSVTAAARRASLCFAQQMVVGDERKVPSTARWVIDRILWEAGVGEQEGEA